MHKDRWKVFGVVALVLFCALILYLKPFCFRTLDMVLIFPEAPNKEVIVSILKDQNIAFKPIDMTDEQIRETVAQYNSDVTDVLEAELKKEKPDKKLLEALQPVILPTSVTDKAFTIKIPRLTEGERKVFIAAVEREAGALAVATTRASWGVLNSGKGSFNLGLDLQGGVQFRLEAYTDDSSQEISREQLNGVIKVMRNRIDPSGVKEINIQIEGSNWINIEIPGERNPERVRAKIKNPALLEFIDPGAKGPLAEGTTVQFVETAEEINTESPPKDEKGNEIFQYTKRELIITGDDLQLAYSGRDPNSGRPEVMFRLSNEGGRKFGDFTSRHVQQYLAIILDKQVISCPQIQSPIWGGSGRITGRFTDEEVQDLVTMLNAGRLPVPVRIVQEETVGPSLGRDSIRKSSTAAVIGVLAVLAFMAIIYRVLGATADLALLYYMIVALGVLAMFDATLTLPGIAGFILSLGMAVDANIIIFERIREEAAAGKTIRNSIDLGFQRAFTAIIDANITTLIGTGVLYWLGTGPIRGFAVTLSIGILASMFSAIIVTRMLLKRSTAIGFLHNLSYYGLKKKVTTTVTGLNKSSVLVDILRNRWKWFAGSLVVIFGGALVTNFWAPEKAFAMDRWRIISLICLAVVIVGFYWIRKIAKHNLIKDLGTGLGIILLFGLIMVNLLDPQGLNWGVDFTGGQRLDIKFEQQIGTSEVDEVLTQLKLAHNPIQLTSPHQALIRWRPDTNGAYLVFEETPDLAEVGDTLKDLDISFGEIIDLGDGKVLIPNSNIDDKAAEVENVLKNVIGPMHTIQEHTYSDGQSELLSQKLGERFGSYEVISKSEIGPSIGEELRKNAIFALLLASLGILIYVGFRFEIIYGIAAIIAVLHDVAVVLALYAIFRWEISSSFVAVVLTIIGYSINDTIVIFDRIRENLNKYKRENPVDVMNVSLWQTMRRSLFTSVTTTLAILAVAVFGGYTIRDFALAILAGVVSGTYSSVMTATPLLTYFTKYQKLSLVSDSDAKKAAVQAARAPRARAPEAAGESAPDVKKPESKKAAEPQAPETAAQKKKKKRAKKGKQRRR